MEVEKFIDETLVDFYCNMCELSGMSEDEIDYNFRGVDGLEASDKEVLITHTDEIVDELILDEAYWFLKDNCEEREIPIERLVSFLVSKYFLCNYEDKSKKRLIDFIKNNSIDKIIKRFMNDDEFGRKTLEAYIHSNTDLKRFNDSRQKIYENNDQTILLSLEGLALDYNVITINELLRNVICNLYNYYISMGYGDIEALNYTWQFFISNFDPVGELDKMGFDQTTKSSFKQYMLCLIYADLYEDACNMPIIQSDNYEDRLASVIPLVMTQLEMINIPKEEGIRNRILKSFILLQDDKEKKCSNRRKTYADNRLNILKKVNPTYMLDEITFNN